MNIVSPYHVTAEDLDLDKKTLEGITPLVEALNVTVPQLVAVAQTVGEVSVEHTVAIGAAVADSFPLVFKNPLPQRPTWVGLTVRPKNVNHVLTAPWVMQGWNLTDQGLISIPWITGLLVDQTYQLTFAVR